jgi:hypothetical protein
MNKQQNPYTKLKDYSFVMLSIYIDTPKIKESFNFTEYGFKQASKLYTEYAKQIRSDDDQYTIKMFSDNGIDCIEYVTDKQLTKSQALQWKLFLTGFYCK